MKYAYPSGYDSKNLPNNGDLRIWWIPQVTMSDCFYVPVSTVLEGKLLLDTLARYDLFQLEHKIKGDYCNAGGLQMFSEEDILEEEEGIESGWTDWYDEETGFDFDDWCRMME